MRTSVPVDSLPDLIQNWSQFVATVRQGYSFSLYDYENDLEIRNRIQTILGSGVEITSEMETKLSAIDQELKRLLIPLRKPLLNGAPPEAFWYFGLPSNADTDLLENAQFLNLLE
jgi:hypothetical protein